MNRSNQPARISRGITGALAIVALAAPLAACQTGAQREMSQLRGVEREVANQYSTCSSAVAARPEYAGLVSKLSLPGTPDSGPSIAQMADTSRPSPEDQRTLMAWHRDWMSCQSARITGFSEIDPRAGVAFQENQAEMDQILVRLANGQATYGEASRELASYYPRARVRIQQSFAGVNGRLEAQHAGEVQRRQAAALSMQQWSLQQQQIAAQRQIAAMPRTVNVNVAPPAFASPSAYVPPAVPAPRVATPVFCNSNSVGNGAGLTVTDVYCSR